MHRHPGMQDGQKIRYATLEGDHIGTLPIYVITGWPSTRTEVVKEAQ